MNEWDKKDFERSLKGSSPFARYLCPETPNILAQISSAEYRVFRILAELCGLPQLIAAPRRVVS